MRLLNLSILTCNLFIFQICAHKHKFPIGDFFNRSIELKNADGSVNGEKAFKVLSLNLVIEDIERIRKNIFKENPDTKILIYGRSGRGFLIQRYFLLPMITTLCRFIKYVTRYLEIRSLNIALVRLNFKISKIH